MIAPLTQMGLRGERPWGEVVEEYDDGSAVLRIESTCFATSMHGYSHGGRVHCNLDDRLLWCPVKDLVLQ